MRDYFGVTYIPRYNRSSINKIFNCSGCINRGYDYIYKFKLNIRDVGYYSSDSENSTLSYYNAAHCKSIYEINDLSFVDYLNSYILNYSVQFTRFCWMHSVGPLIYTSRIFGINKPLPYSINLIHDFNINNLINNHGHIFKSVTKYKCITGLNDNLKPIEVSYNTKSDAEENAIYAYDINNIPTTNKNKDLKSMDSEYKSCIAYYDIDSYPSITLLLSFGAGFLSSLDIDNKWKMFFVKLNNHSKIGSVLTKQDKNEKWKQFKDCICAYKMGIVSIPFLDKPELNVSDKVNYLQKINPCDNHIFTKKIWDKTSEKKVQEKIEDVNTLTDMIAYINSSFESII